MKETVKMNKLGKKSSQQMQDYCVEGQDAFEQKDNCSSEMQGC